MSHTIYTATMQITSRFMCAGLLINRGYVSKAAPIINYMNGWSTSQVTSYCRRRGFYFSIKGRSTD